MKKFLFILSGNLSTTPRALKSILSLPHDYELDIVVINRNKLWAEKDSEIIKEYNLNVKHINLGRKPFYPWLKATILEKISQKFYPICKNSLNINAFASNKSSILLWHYLKDLNKTKYDFVLGYSAGSIYPIYKIAQKWRIPFLVDVEDYYPGEQIQIDSINEKKRREFLMEEILPKADVLTTASPLIAEYTLNLIGGHSRHTLVLNSFPMKEFIYPESVKIPKSIRNKLKIVWFSQKVSFERGLEQFFDSLLMLDLEKNSQCLEITLIGEMDPSFRQKIIMPFREKVDLEFLNIKEISPIPQKKLHLILTEFDIGLALEPGKDLNNELALSNKIITYAQAGLFILATATRAQVNFMQRHPEIGIISKQTTIGIKESIEKLFKEFDKIRFNKIARFEKGKLLSWENGGGNLIELIRGLKTDDTDLLN